MQALIVEHGSNRGGLAAARGLKRAGWTVDVVSGGDGLTTASRAVRHVHRVAYPDTGPEGLVAAVRDAVAAGGIDVVLPVDETQLLALSAARETLDAAFPFPEHRALLRTTDRLEQARAAERAGLDPPRTEPGDGEVGSSTLAIKARTPKLHSTDRGWARFETTIVPAAEVRDRVAGIERDGGEAVLQEVLSGDLASVTVLTDADGALVALVQQVAERIWPPGAGTSSRAVTTPIDEDLRDRVLAFLADLGWHGFAQLQFLATADGRLRLIDVNPRFYGSLSLAIGAGADFPRCGPAWPSVGQRREAPRPAPACAIRG